jgi:hypothetical protein
MFLRLHLSALSLIPEKLILGARFHMMHVILRLDKGPIAVDRRRPRNYLTTQVDPTSKTGAFHENLDDLVVSPADRFIPKKI